MPTPKCFSQCPGFPSDLPVAQIPVLSFQDLQYNSDSESEKLYEASREHGFFFLDLRDSREGETLLQDAERIFHIAAMTLNLDKKVLDKYAYNPPRSLLGCAISEKDWCRSV